MTDLRWKTTPYAGWGRALKATGPLARPDTRNELTEAAFPAHGNRRSYGDAPLNSAGAALDMSRLDRIIAFDTKTGVLEAEAGVTISTLARICPAKGWLPAVMPGTGFATIGGAIAMDVHGKNHHNKGSFGQHVKAITLLQGSETRTITPKDKTLWQATVGGLGQTGIILSARIQLSPCAGRQMRVTETRASDWAEHIALLDASDATYCVGWIDATATGDALGRGIVEEAEIAAGSLPPAQTPTSRAVPFNAPHFALAAPIVRAFNQLYYHRVPEEGRTLLRPMQDFFFPLDRIHDWNRLYGRRGFHQFQCVVPPDQTDALRAMAEAIATSGLASPLAVLKKMGKGRAGYLSFPMEGFTLAVDFPNRPAAVQLIAELDRLTEAAGGRIYLAKDSLASCSTVRAMYPDYAAWRDAVEKADPDHRLATDLIRRLGLRSPS